MNALSNFCLFVFFLLGTRDACQNILAEFNSNSYAFSLLACFLLMTKDQYGKYMHGKDPI